jgi:pimeloyl-ACP methyl ester carboxylesterase
MIKFNLIGLVLILLSCASHNNSNRPILLVPGAHFNQEIFESLISELDKFRIHAKAIHFNKNKDVTLDNYAQAVCEELSKIGKTLVLGLSQGGAVINQAYGLCPQYFLGMIYVAATIPLPQERPFSLLTLADDEYYFKAVVEDKKNQMFKIADRNLFVQAFAPDASELELRTLIEMMHDEPSGPSQSKINFKMDDYQKLPKLIIHTVQDRVITYATQIKYAERLKNAKITHINSSHLPMLTRPYELARTISAEFY